MMILTVQFHCWIMLSSKVDHLHSSTKVCHKDVKVSAEKDDLVDMEEEAENEKADGV